jgi:hypothetical protein
MTDQTWNRMRDQLAWHWTNQLRDLHLHTHQQTRREAS